LVAFKPQPIDWAKVPGSTSTVNNITTNTDANITNRDGLVVVGGAQPTSGYQDNSPVTIVPPVVPIVPVVVVPK
jgi:hypothetical protein